MYELIQFDQEFLNIFCRLDVNMQDLESALTFIFTREIVIKKSLHKEHLERFVNLLVQVI